MSDTNTSFTWRVVNLERETADGYVYTAHYTVNATDGTYSAGAYGSIGFERPEGELIPFSQLTEDQIVMEWLLPKFGEEKVQEIHAALQTQLDEQRQPTRAAGLPWVSDVQA
jgi:hypothetical protein